MSATETNRHLLEKSIITAFGIIITVCSFFYLLRPINDTDFFWHLKTGEYIWQTKTLPQEDPFCFTAPAGATSRTHFILTSYWLSQLLFSFFFAAGDLNGLVALRLLIAVPLIVLMLKNRRGDLAIHLGLLVPVLIAVFEGYPLERPQFFSFIFFAALLLILNRIKSEQAKPGEHFHWGDMYSGSKPFLLCVLMLIWSNMHGGYLVGQATITLYLVAEGIKFMHKNLQPLEKHVYLKLLGAGIAGILCSLVNPNTYHALGELMSMPPYMKDYNIEFQSTFEIFRRYGNSYIMLFWAIVCVAAVSLVMEVRRFDLTEAVLLSCTGYFALTQIRYSAFFLIAALPVMTRAFSQKKVRNIILTLLIPAVLSVTGYFMRDEFGNARNLLSRTWVNEHFFPAKAADFIRDVNVRGNMFNEQNWGGYLIWRFGTDRKVFMDGRQLNESIYAQATLIQMAYAENISGVPFWKSMLNAYHVSYAVIPIFQINGTMTPLVLALLKEPEWNPVFIYENSTIFVKDSPENSHVLTKWSIPKTSFINHLIGVNNVLLRDNPQNVSAYIAKGDLFMIMEKRKDAYETYTQALNIAPRNMIVRERLMQFRP